MVDWTVEIHEVDMYAVSHKIEIGLSSFIWRWLPGLALTFPKFEVKFSQKFNAYRVVRALQIVSHLIIIELVEIIPPNILVPKKHDFKFRLALIFRDSFSMAVAIALSLLRETLCKLSLICAAL